MSGTAQHVDEVIPAKFLAITAWTAADKDLNYEVGAGTQFRVIATIPRNAQVTLSGEGQYVENSRWVKVRVGRQKGRVNQNFLR
jgi:uncharacterized protein YraI